MRILHRHNCVSLLQTLAAVGLLCAAASVSGDSNLPVLFSYSQPSHSVSIFRGADLERLKGSGLGAGGGYPVAAPAPPPPVLPPPPPPPAAHPPPPPPPPPAPVVYRPAPAPLVYQPAPAPIVYKPAPAPIVYKPPPAPIIYNPPPAPVAYRPAPAYVEPEYYDVNTSPFITHKTLNPINPTILPI
jgi:hypothetical protein